MTAEKSLDAKLAEIVADPHGSQAFVMADAKDPDMAFGIPATGVDPAATEDRLPYRSRERFLEHVRELVREELVDVMLMSCATSEQLVIRERLFDDSPVTPAVRMNDTTDIWRPRGGKIHEAASRPFRSTTIDHARSGRISPAPDGEARGVDLGLYSVTFNNDRDADHDTLSEYNWFRAEAESKNFRHFLEVFDPNVHGAVPRGWLPEFVNDMIARCLAGVPSAARPLFLKIAYHGPRAMEELTHYDPTLPIGVLGGAAGTTRDAFQLIHDARKYGARIALFGRKINHAEHQPTFVRFLWRIVNGEIDPEEAVRAYHAELESLGLSPTRSLADDVKLDTHQTEPFGA